MQYVRSFGGSVSGAWNAINPANLSGAIDVIVVEQEDGTLACSPFHVRFGKFSLLRPFEKKVQFKVNEVKQEYAMKLGEGGDAFFVFETQDDVPEGMQTSPLISPAGSPGILSGGGKTLDGLQEPEYLDITGGPQRRPRPTSAIFSNEGVPIVPGGRAASDLGNITPLSTSPSESQDDGKTADWLNANRRMNVDRSASDMGYRGRDRSSTMNASLEAPPCPANGQSQSSSTSDARSRSPPPVSSKEALERAKALSKRLEVSNIPSRIMESGDLMLDMQGYKANEEDALRAEVIARQILSEELQGDFDVGAIMSADEEGNLWIYSSEEAKEAAKRRKHSFAQSTSALTSDAASDPGFQSDEEGKRIVPQRSISDRPQVGMVTPPQTPPETGTVGDPNKNYVKTLRLTSDQLKSMNLKRGANKMTFTVARATCTAWLFYWSYKVPLVVSDIDGTITKSDALGHVLNMIGRDWTHTGVAKLYQEIVANGYNILYLSSRSVGQADTTRAYLHGVLQDGYKLPHGPVILSPDRTLAALRREVYLRKPEIFKMQCLRDIMNLYSPGNPGPFYAGFGNRLTDAVSYRTVSIPSNRIFTINSNAEVSLDLVNFTKYRASYTSIREVVDHYFPPVGLLVQGEEYTDFQIWRNKPLDVEEFSGSEDEEEDEDELPVSKQVSRERQSIESEDHRTQDEDMEDEGDTYLSDEAEELANSMVGSLDEMYLSPRPSIDEQAQEEESDLGMVQEAEDNKVIR